MPAETPAVADGKHIHAAIWAVMKSVTFVAKSGQYSGGSSGSYAFRRFDDTAAAIGTAFREHGVFVQVRTGSREIAVEEKPYKNGNGVQLWTTVRVEVEYLFTSLVDGSTLSAFAFGEGKDASDKATAKAMTMALKTALTQAFMIPTDDPDPDSERPGEEDQSRTQQRPQQNRPQNAPPAQVPPREQRPAGTAPSNEQRAAYALWLEEQLAAPGIDLGRVNALLGDARAKGMLGYEHNGVTLKLRIQSVGMTLGQSPDAAPLPEDPGY
jgi:ERF superfamily